MPAAADPDGSEAVNDFLQGIKDLGDQRDREDEERTRKLEEEILQGRKERQARRAERARSLSPTKDASMHSDTPSSAWSHHDNKMLDGLSKTPSLPQPPVTQVSAMDNIPTKSNSPRFNLETKGSSLPSLELPRPPSKPEHGSSASSSAAIAPTRSNPLSWQRRPSSRGSVKGSIRSRPSSAVASDSATSRSPCMNAGEAGPEGEDGVSRSQIAQSLGAKDPTFFKQTEDRGFKSAAYRKNQIEDAVDSAPTGRSMKLTGMSRENIPETESQKESPLPSHSVNKLSTEDSTPVSMERSYWAPLPTSSSQHFETLQSETTKALGSDDVASAGRPMAMSPSQGRLSPERWDRPASPTKGLGGFVQSAMMKRSDSVNKRWSAQAGPGLSRGNSVTSAVGTHDGVRLPIGGITTLNSSRQSSTRETTPSVSSRPSSSHNYPNAPQSSVDAQSMEGGISLGSRQTQLSSTASGPTRVSAEASAMPTDISVKGESLTSPLTSPSKRWSPTKSSWLENAISKPESPKILSPAISQQPSWMADLNRSKQQRGSVDLGNGAAFDKVATGGPVRSPLPGIGLKPQSLGGSSGVLKPDSVTKPRTKTVEKVRQSSLEQQTNQTDELSKSSKMSKLSGNSGKAPISPPTGIKPPHVESSPASTKIKPDALPKKDFRSNIKPQQVVGESKDKDEPEFKNVFGKLKKTQTQNYVAPDELKENIMRGKTGLAKTGGPQKSIIRDEFKESILKKKEGMKVPTASTNLGSASSKVVDTSTPEAIAKRRGLGRSDSNVSNVSDRSLEDRKSAPKPEALSKLQSLQEKSRPTVGIASETDQRSIESSKPGLGGGFASSLTGILQKGPPRIRDTATHSQGFRAGDASAKSASMDAGLGLEPVIGSGLTHATKGRARGPKRKLPSAVSRDSHVTPNVIEARHQSSPALTEHRSSTLTSPQPDLEPERYDSKPLSVITDSKNNIRQSTQSSTSRRLSTNLEKNMSSRPSPLTTAQASTGEPSPQSSPVNIRNPMNGSQKTPKIQDSNMTNAEENNHEHREFKISKELPNKSNDDGGEMHEPLQALPSVKGMAGIWNQSPRPSRMAEPRLPIKLPTRMDEEAAMADAGLRPREIIGLGIETDPQATQISQQATAMPITKGPRSPPPIDKKHIQLQTRRNNEAPVTDTKVPSVETLEKDIDTALKATQVSQRERANPSTKNPRSPPTPGRKPVNIDSKTSTPPLPSPTPPKRTTSPLKEPSESTKLFVNIFDEPPNKTNVSIDTQAFLDKDSSGDPEKIKTLRKQILEITDNGKSVPVPPDQEHILFEDSLYLCTHIFGTSTGARKTEVYLWCGDGVSSSAVEDAHLFARKTAKENSGKLLLLRQGKEPSIFFQALGGIVITRRGSNNRSDSATYMLCGRRHLGQIAFDEVDFHPQSLCVGFPYIISARGGRLYLWKGSGASADELGCARLIGMDLGLTGEIEEVDVGKEPAEFWSSFPTRSSKPATTTSQPQYWHLKPTCEKYANKLFEIDVELPRPKSSSGFMSWGRRGSALANDTSGTMEAKVKDITPFSQADLVEDGVFVLDAFFEVYIIFRLRTSAYPAPQHRSTKSSCFRAALLFAQDYGILAASVEDRPFVPQSYVVILSKPDGSPNVAVLPESMKACFRKWSGDGIGQENVRVLPLTEALTAEES